MKVHSYTVVLERNEDGGYTVTVPALKGCVTQGPTLAESLRRAEEAITGYLAVLVDVGKRIPIDCKAIKLDTEEISEALIFKINITPAETASNIGVKVA
jgi:predicted RNase H-like HicB family nuclease